MDVMFGNQHNFVRTDEVKANKFFFNLLKMCVSKDFKPKFDFTR